MRRILKIIGPPSDPRIIHLKELLLNENISSNIKDRNMEVIFEDNTTFGVRLFGYNGQIKTNIDKYSDNLFQNIFKLIDTMTIRKMEMLVGGDMNLYNIKNKKFTLNGTGFKDKKTVENTFKLIYRRSLYYQKALIITLYNRSKYHPGQTPEMEEARKILKKWLDDHKIIKDQYPFLDLKLVEKYEKLADIYNISRVARGLDKPTKSDEGFLKVYKKVKGNRIKLAFIPIFKNKPDGLDYYSYRDNFLKARLGQMKSYNVGLYNKTGEFKDLPTKQHMVLIMNGFSPDIKGVEKRLKLLKL